MVIYGTRKMAVNFDQKVVRVIIYKTQQTLCWLGIAPDQSLGVGVTRREMMGHLDRQRIQ